MTLLYCNLDISFSPEKHLDKITFFHRNKANKGTGENTCSIMYLRAWDGERFLF
jgi:hypothetical protein